MNAYTTKERDLPGPRIGGYGRMTDAPMYFGPEPPLGSPMWHVYSLKDPLSGFRIPGHQTTISRTNPGYPRKNTYTAGNTGGNFFTQKTRVVHDGLPRVSVKIRVPGLYGSGNYFVYENAVFMPDFPPAWGGSAGVTFPPQSASSASQLEAWGTTAIERCNPTRSVAELSVALGELKREGIASLPLIRSFEKRLKIAKAAGSEFLNVAFGWLPLVNDVKDVSKSVIRSNEILSQLYRDSGKWVRRRYNFPTTVDTQHSTYFASIRWGGNKRWSLNWMMGVGEWQSNVSITTRTTRKRWFSGAFTYYVPVPKDYRSDLSYAAASARKTLGLKLTPDVLWNLTPWSWALDWFGNIGDIISNFSDHVSNGTILRYGYMMEETIVTTTYAFVPAPGSPKHAVPGSLTVETVTKQRVEAGPYGFGMKWEDLSPFQISVLGALGLSRSS